MKKNDFATVGLAGLLGFGTALLVSPVRLQPTRWISPRGDEWYGVKCDATKTYVLIAGEGIWSMWQNFMGNKWRNPSSWPYVPSDYVFLGVLSDPDTTVPS